MKNILLILFLIISSSVYSQTKHWVLGGTLGYTNVVTPFQRTNYSLSLNLRYQVKAVTFALQPTVNYTIQTKMPDFRIGVRLQYDFIRW